MQHQTLDSYIEDKKNLYTSIHVFLEESDENSEKLLQEIINIIRNQQIEKEREEMGQFLEIIKSIGEHRRRDQHFNEKINQPLLRCNDKSNRPCQIPKYFTYLKTTKKIIFNFDKQN